jgi:hypothetical protein
MVSATERLAANRTPTGTPIQETQEQADDGVEQGDAGVGQHVAVHEHIPQTLRDGAGLADPERVHEPRRRDLPDRDQGKSQDELRRDLGSDGDFSRGSCRHDQISCQPPEPRAAGSESRPIQPTFHCKPHATCAQASVGCCVAKHEGGLPHRRGAHVNARPPNKEIIAQRALLTR